MMKKINILTLGMALVAGLSSCEMADEMRGNDSSKEMGALDLSVSVAQTESRANGDSNIATDNFEVVITDTENAENTYTYVYSELSDPVQLPAGSYTVTANTPGKIQTKMDYPYFKGSEPLTITGGVTSQVNVVCKMANTKIDITYSEDFTNTFQSWTINLDDGADHTLTFSNEDLTHNTVYWYLGEGVATMTMNIEATLNDGSKIRDQKQFTKADADQSYGDGDTNFAGGDELKINFNIDENEPSEDNRPQIGFDIKVDITFSDTNETVEIPVEDVPTEPEEPGDDNNIVISDNGTGYLTNGVTVEGMNHPTDVVVMMTAPDGIKSVYVKVVTDNRGFELAAGGMGLTTGDGLDLTSEKAQDLSFLFDLPEAGNTEYTFTMNNTLFKLLEGDEENEVARFSGKHDFILTVIDTNDNQKSATLTINVD